jgi:hypothetical protein
MKSMKQLTMHLTMVVAACLVSFSIAIGQDLELNIIGNPESVPAELNMNLLRSVFRGEKQRWDDGVSIKIALMKTSTPIGVSTCKKVYNMTGNELNKYFLALVFQGKAKAPIFFNSIKELENYVAETPGAIGVSQNTIEGPIKIVTVDGKKQL